jgi:DNA-binding NtrC family response regulator
MDSVGHIAQPHDPPRILLLDSDPAIAETLPALLKNRISDDLAVEYCLSQRHALHCLSTGSYHALICSPFLMLAQETSLLTRSRSVHPQVPFLLTLEKHERGFAGDWLDWGAYDFIFKPVDEQAVYSIGEAIALYKWRTIIVDKEKTLQRLRQRRELYRQRSAGTQLAHDVDPLLDTSIVRIEQAKNSLKKSTERIRASLEILRANCATNEREARQRALQRLGPIPQL